MFKIKALGMTALAAAAIGVGGLAAAPPASAAPRYSCDQALVLADHYVVTGHILLAAGNTSAASAYFGRANGIYLVCG